MHSECSHYKWLKIHYCLPLELHARKKVSEQMKKYFTIIDFLFSCCCCEWLRRERNLKSVLNVVTFINCVTFARILDFLPSIFAFYFFPRFFLSSSGLSLFFCVLFMQCMGFIPFKLSFVCYFHAKSDLRFCLWLQALFCFRSFFCLVLLHSPAHLTCCCWKCGTENGNKVIQICTMYYTNTLTLTHMEW